jgi:hypothetical protein
MVDRQFLDVELYGFRLIEWITAALIVLVIILLIVNIVSNDKTKKLRNQYLAFINGSPGENMEQIMISLKARLYELEQMQTDMQRDINDQQRQLREKKGNIGLTRYNTFQDGGSEISFSLAIVNEAKDGMVLSALNNRDQSFLYAKQVERGTSAYYKLSQEEMEAIELALHSEQIGNRAEEQKTS